MGRAPQDDRMLPRVERWEERFLPVALALFAPRRDDPDLAKLPLRRLCSPKGDLKKPSKISQISQIALRQASRHALFHSRLVRRFGQRSGFISNDWCLEKLASAPGGANTPAPKNSLFLI
jgi:hypothetical protein